MSGGSLDYFYARLREHVGDFGDVELDDLTKDLAELFYQREWFLSGDTGEGNWREARKVFKQKWLRSGSREERFEKYIDIAIESIRNDFGLNDHKRCESCKHWVHEHGSYGDCEFRTTYTHKGEICEKWEEKEEK